MNRRPLVAFALLASLLLVATPFTGSVAAGSTKTVVGSQHTTDSDFNSAAELTNLSVVGSGQSADVELQTKSGTTDGYESGSLSNYTLAGPYPGAWGVSSTAAKVGTHAAQFNGSNNAKDEVALRGQTSGYFHLEGWAKGSDWYGLIGKSKSTKPRSGLALMVQPSNNRFRLSNRSRGNKLASSSPSLSGTTWYYLALSYYPSNSTLIGWIDTDSNYKSGYISKLSAVVVSAPSGQSYGLWAHDAGPSLRYWDNVHYDQVSHPAHQATYISANHQVTNASTAAVDISVTNASATATVQQWTGSVWTDVNSATWTTSANHTLDISGATYDTLRVNVTFQTTGSNPSARLHDESILFVDHAPTVDDASASPSGNKTLSHRSVSLSINVADREFPTAQGDTVTGTYYVKAPGASSYTQVGTQSTTSNGTLSLSYMGTDGGTYQWRVELTDSYSLTATSSNFSFNAPDQITIRNETDASQKIKGANITATFYSADGTTVIKRSDTNNDGNISLTGLPTTKEFVAVIEANDYYLRRVYIKSIYNQQDVYLLNKTAYPNAIVTIFQYEDRTGDFPTGNTTLRIQRALDPNDDSVYQWETVAGDFWGAAGEFTFIGQKNARYRLIIENEQGTQRVLGTHIPIANGTKSIVIGRIRWEPTNGTGRFFDASLDPGNNRITIKYDDPTTNTTKLRIRVWQLGNKSNEILDANYTGTYGKFAKNISVTNNQSKESWVVNYTATHQTKGELSSQLTIGGSPLSLPVDPWLLGTLAWIAITFVATLYGPRTAQLGAFAIVGLAAVLMVFTWITIPPVNLLVAAGIAVGGALYREGVPG